MKNNIQTLKGFRDFLPNDMKKRDFLISKIREVFIRFGFEPVQTPTLEYANLILGKYGEVTDKLVYTFKDLGDRLVALPYDLTVPTARLLAQYKDLPKYFRRYQIQNVFRADKPQKGRYREFTQCDIDIFGSKDALADAEVIACAYAVFEALGYTKIEILINDRAILTKNLKTFESKKLSLSSIIQIIDKLDKKSEAEVVKELTAKGLANTKAKKAINLIKQAKISAELEKIIKRSIKLGVSENVIKFTPTLTRGLDYYTGMIFEIAIPEYPIGSFGGGGRYDNLINKLSGVDIAAVGFSFGLDRLLDAADKLKLYPDKLPSTQVLVTVFSPKYSLNSINVVNLLRKSGIACELFPDETIKLDKQLKYADKKHIPWVVIIGPKEILKEQVVLKNLKTKRQETIPMSALLTQIK